MTIASQAAQNDTAGSDRVPQPENGGAGTECLQTARELQLVLEEEAEKLKRFAGAELLEVISRKEFLVEELSQKLGALKKTADTQPAIPASLKAVLEKIDALNRSNKNFIQNSLAHWQDLLSLLCPAGYGPTAEGKTGIARPPKGLAFSREI